MKKNYIINYQVINNKAVILKSGIFRVKNKMSDFDAMASLDDYLKKKVAGFYKMIVIKCEEETILHNIFGTNFNTSIFDLFKK